MSKAKESKFVLVFAGSIAVFSLFIYFTSDYPNSVRGAAFGGLLALYGVILMAMPVLRADGVLIKNLMALYGLSKASVYRMLS